MTKFALVLLAFVLYLSAAGLFWRAQSTGHGRSRSGILVLVAGALILHGSILYGDLFQNSLRLGLTTSASLVAWTITALFLLAVLFEPIDSLGILILPLCALSLVGAWQWPGPAGMVWATTPAQASHVIVSLLAYSLLGVALFQAVVLGVQERALHRRQAGGFLKNLPPLETMERLLFRMLGIGFILLTLTLVSGLFFSEQTFGRPLRFNHHIVLSIVAWMVFAVLLVGHWRFGWRGRTATRLTVAGFLLLVLGYFGTKFVLEVILRRPGA